MARGSDLDCYFFGLGPGSGRPWLKSPDTEGVSREEVGTDPTVGEEILCVPASLTLPCPSAKLKRLDLSSNFISAIDDDALHLLPALQDLILSENQLVALPVLPSSIELLDVRLNRLRSSGIQPGAFGVSGFLQTARCCLPPALPTYPTGFPAPSLFQGSKCRPICSLTSPCVAC